MPVVIETHADSGCIYAPSLRHLSYGPFFNHSQFSFIERIVPGWAPLTSNVDDMVVACNDHGLLYGSTINKLQFLRQEYSDSTAPVSQIVDDAVLVVGESELLFRDVG